MNIIIESRPSAPEWTVESFASADGAVAALELVLAPNAQRLARLGSLWAAGIVLVGWGPGRRFALFWEDCQRVHIAASDTFADACTLFAEKCSALSRREA